MSFNRENVTWVDVKGCWWIGFFVAEVTGDDPEWDVEYDMSRFKDVYGPGESEEAVWDQYRRFGSINPGGTMLCTDPVEGMHYDLMRRALPMSHQSTHGSRSYA